MHRHGAGYQGRPKFGFINTSFAERQNLIMRMSMRRFTRLKNKKFENHCHVLALYFVWYNFCTRRMTGDGRERGPSSHEHIRSVFLIDEREGPPKSREPYLESGTTSRIKSLTLPAVVGQKSRAGTRRSGPLLSAGDVRV
jgi:hypothetical protein